ncbi:hypothetical protein DSM25558_4869 [Agrobacterium sp. DSM 25558]|uniref:hypothetical protein n=1 Tax=Agrobacterium sp. DSM 25558 TaxID=1907665 RepID=UPI0009725F61|nr:hypothetical protein [Agrobacterium sp. DSM 25558]SCX30138.1 hypothetical protein DSM25558_4869 [Agrobacterium sp. DSM 25558]
MAFLKRRADMAGVGFVSEREKLITTMIRAQVMKRSWRIHASTLDSGSLRQTRLLAA